MIEFQNQVVHDYNHWFEEPWQAGKGLEPQTGRRNRSSCKDRAAAIKAEGS